MPGHAFTIPKGTLASVSQAEEQLVQRIVDMANDARVVAWGDEEFNELLNYYLAICGRKFQKPWIITVYAADFVQTLGTLVQHGERLISRMNEDIVHLRAYDRALSWWVLHCAQSTARSLMHEMDVRARKSRQVYVHTPLRLTLEREHFEIRMTAWTDVSRVVHPTIKVPMPEENNGFLTRAAVRHRRRVHAVVE